MNHLRWVAWGVVNPDDAGSFDRIQRRNYIKRMRGDLKEIGAVLNCGGSTKQPWYQISLKPLGVEPRSKAVGGEDAFKKVCQWALQELGDVSGPDGGVRCAGDEAQDGADAAL